MTIDDGYDAGEEGNSPADESIRMASMRTIRMSAMRIWSDRYDEDSDDSESFEPIYHTDSSDTGTSVDVQSDDSGSSMPALEPIVWATGEGPGGPTPHVPTLENIPAEVTIVDHNPGMTTYRFLDDTVRVLHEYHGRDQGEQQLFDQLRLTLIPYSPWPDAMTERAGLAAIAALDHPAPRSPPSPPHSFTTVSDGGYPRDSNTEEIAWGSTDPEDHLLTVERTVFTSNITWQDNRERSFNKATLLRDYNRILAIIVGCGICECCTPTVHQKLVHIGRGVAFSRYVNVFTCTRDATPDPINDSHDSSPDEPLAVLENYTDDEIENNSYNDDFECNSESLYAARIVHSANVRRRDEDLSSPSRPKRFFTTLVAELKINGHKALVLFDSGSTTDSVTPEFAFVSKMKQFRLTEQIILQLGCVGSRSKISYGSHAPITLPGGTESVYFDIVNIDRYDAILGTPFLERFDVLLDIQDRSVRIRGTRQPTFTYNEELAYIAMCRDPATRGPRRTHATPTPAPLPAPTPAALEPIADVPLRLLAMTADPLDLRDGYDQLWLAPEVEIEHDINVVGAAAPDEVNED